MGNAPPKGAFISFQPLMVLDGRLYRHFLALSTKANVNVLNLTFSFAVPLGFMLVHTT